MRSAAPNAFRLKRQQAWRRAHQAYIAFLCAWGLVCLPSISEIVSIWSGSATYAHGALAIPLSLAMIIYAQRRGAPGRPRPWPVGLLALAGVFAVWRLAAAADINALAHLATIAMPALAALVAYGPRLGRRWSFALVFSLFAAPFGEVLVPYLQSATAVAAEALLAAAGVESTRDGLLITAGGRRFLVAEGCAGLGSIVTALMAACLYARYALDGWKPRAVLIGAAIAVAIVANMARVFGVIAFVAAADPASPLAADHASVSAAAQLVAVAATLALGVWMARRTDRWSPALRHSGATS